MPGEEYHDLDYPFALSSPDEHYHTSDDGLLLPIGGGGHRIGGSIQQDCERACYAGSADYKRGLKDMFELMEAESEEYWFQNGVVRMLAAGRKLLSLT